MMKTLTSINQRMLPEVEEVYPHARIWINGRHVYVEKIVQAQEVGRSTFEQSVFDFIRSWISGDQSFELTTSGSTGPPKSIIITREQMLRSAKQTCARIGLLKNTRALVCIDPRYIGGKMMLVRCLAFGFRIMAIDPVANPLIRIPVDKCVQFTAVVPYQIQAILESKHPHLLNNLNHVLIGGAPLSNSARDQLDRFQCRCYETYGMTETVSHVALRLANTNSKQQYFETLPGVEITLDARGCLVISADFLSEPVITNDLAKIIEAGRFIWLGRWDSVINSGGVKISPERIELEIGRIFYKNNFNHRFFIAGLPDERLTEKVVLIVEGVQFSSEALEQSLTELREAVSPYEFPREIYSIPEFVLTSTQKIDRVQTLPGITLLSSLK